MILIRKSSSSTGHSMSAALPVGSQAPDFAIAHRSGASGNGGRARRFADFRGSPVVVVFHSEPDELAFERNDSSPKLLSGVDDAAHLFGIDGETAVFVVDGDGVIRWRHVAEPAPSGACSRREFVATALGVAFALALEPHLARAESLASDGGDGASAGARNVTLNVNGKPITLTLEPRVSLLDALREYAGLTGTKKGCDHGQCGACTVHVDGKRQLSCLTFAVMQQGKRITTIEGLAAESGAMSNALAPVQQAFVAHDGFQCGYCTPGQLMSASAMLDEPWGPTDDDVREAMSGNICRCGAYPGIVAAIQEARQQRGDSR
jgi:xanthine dehydrogenase YagT iron-sulfur-binding subunit